MALVYGFMRFSFLGISDARATHTLKYGGEVADLAATAYADDRMEERFHYLEQICLPSLVRQNSRIFRQVIVTSPQMPQKWRERLERSVAPHTNIFVYYSTAEHISNACDDWMAENNVGVNSRVVTFRIDDDDAIANWVCDEMSTLGDILDPETIISFPRGFHVGVHDGQYYLLRKLERDIAIALGRVCAPGKPMSPYRGSHGDIWQSNPSFSNPARYAYLHVHHSHSDTAVVRNKLDVKLQRDLRFDTTYNTERGRGRIKTILRTNFAPLDVEDLERQMMSAPSALAAQSEKEAQEVMIASPTQMSFE